MPKLQLSWISALGLALLLAISAVGQPTNPGYIRLARVTGDVSVENKASGQQQPGVNAMEITQGTIVRTAAGSSVILVFSNGSTINLGADSVLDIQEYLQDPFAGELRPSEMTAEPTVSRTRLGLTQGELVGNVKTLRQSEGSSFTVQTPAGAAGIRGTTFRIAFRPAGNGQAFFTLTTLEGQVGFAALEGALDTPQALVADSQQVTVTVNVDDQTGQVTLVTPASAIAAQVAPTADIAAVTASVQEVSAAIVDLVLPPPANAAPDGGSGGAGGEGGGDDDADEDANAVEDNADEDADADAGADADADADTDGNGGNAASDRPEAEAEEPPPPQPDNAPPVIGRNNPDLTPGDGRRGGE